MIIYSLVYYKHKLENHIFRTKNDVNNKMYPPWCYEKNILYLSEQAEFGRDLYKCDSDVDAHLFRYEDTFHLNQKEYKNHTYSHRFYVNIILMVYMIMSLYYLCIYHFCINLYNLGIMISKN